jgi:hypothetical protein
LADQDLQPAAYRFCSLAHPADPISLSRQDDGRSIVAHLNGECPGVRSYSYGDVGRSGMPHDVGQ